MHTHDEEVRVLFDDGRITCGYSDLEELVLAYGVSVNESQSQEYSCLVILLLTQHYVMLQRNLIYAAITRGEKLVILVGSKRALAIAVKNDKMQNPYALLEGRMQAA
jgi:exodeoxyribonuclease V alpha subunit